MALSIVNIIFLCGGEGPEQKDDPGAKPGVTDLKRRVWCIFSGARKTTHIMTIQSNMYASMRRLDGTLRSTEFIVLIFWLLYVVSRSTAERGVASGSAEVDGEGVSWSWARRSEY
jgi:hypothetical protein